MAADLQRVAIPNPKTQQLELVDPRNRDNVHVVKGYRENVYVRDFLKESFRPLTPLFSPDGRLLLAGHGDAEQPEADGISLWETATAARRPFVLHGRDVILDNPAFSPDGTMLALVRGDWELCLVSTATGAMVRKLGQITDLMAAPPAFTPDGRTLITAVHDRLQMWEIATGGQIARRERQTADIRELIVSGDGRTLATVLADRTILAWHLAHLVALPAAASPPEKLWDDLASPDAVRGRRAVEALVADVNTVALLRKRVKPVPRPDPKRLARSIANLDSDDFETRRRAEDELDHVSAAAGPALRKALTAGPTLEAQRRIDRLLKKLDPLAIPTGETLRELRAVQVLEMRGDAEARRLLQKLAQGAAEARLTEDAAAALARLER
jgi:hypothetical protein